jgi:uncharacterized protein YciI
MAKFIFILSNKRKGKLTEELLNGHVKHLKDLKNKGLLFLCGPFEDNDGAIQILEAKTKEEATKHFLQDPFILNNYFEKYTSYELIEANDDNDWLMNDKQTKNNLL